MENSGGLASARSLLFVPGDRPDRFAKAAASGADLVVLDLEDGVGLGDKAGARDRVAEWLAGTGEAVVRVNAVDTAYFANDCAALAGLAGLRAVMLPKADSATVVAAARAALGPVPIIALIESGWAVHRAHEIAAAGVARLAFGSIDYALDLAMEETHDALLSARSTVVLASRLGGLPAPIDGVTTTLDDPSVAGADAARSRALGFGGKLCVHPRQVGQVNAAFTPTEEDVAWARAVLGLEAAGGAARHNGQMIDRPVLDRARLILGQFHE